MRQDLLLKILSTPSSPFRESLVLAVVRMALDEGGVPHFTDSFGNLVVGAASRRDYGKKLRAARAAEPLRLFIAHADHPGFHGEKWISERRLSAKWFGGSPTAGLVGSRVWISDAAGEVKMARVASVKLAKHGRAIERLELTLTNGDFAARDPRRLFGGFGFRAPVWRDGKMLYTKAADDLVGVFAIVQTAIDLYATKSDARKRFAGLVTRGEEVGFIGAIAHFDRYLPKDDPRLLAISLEASRTLPGALVGRGPIVRLGDRGTVFDAGALRVFTELAERVLPKKHQRRVMDGGSCEASVAVSRGLPCVGISVPLGNYHNQNLEGGPDASRAKLGPAPEFVHLDDIRAELKLCRALLEAGLPWEKPWTNRWKQLKKQQKAYSKYL